MQNATLEVVFKVGLNYFHFEQIIFIIGLISWEVMKSRNFICKLFASIIYDLTYGLQVKDKERIWEAAGNTISNKGA